MSLNKQPYISWKGPSAISATSTWSRPLTNQTITTDPEAAEANKAGSQATTSTNYGSWRITRPIKHWRKQLQPENVSGYSRSSTSIQELPGSNTVISDGCCSRNRLHTDISLNHATETSHAETVVGPNNSTRCISCIKRIKPTAGLNTVPINSQNPSTAPTQTYNFDTKSYLRSRNKNYNSNWGGNMKKNINYSILSPNGCCAIPLPYTNDTDGPQVRSSMVNTNVCNATSLDVIVKPNNQQYFQQGAVSSSSRLQRLKYNTITSNAHSYKTAWGASAASAGRYSENGNSPYFIKTKNNVCNPRDFNKNYSC